MAAESKVTTDPKVIKKWAEERDGKPAQIKGTGGKDDAGLLRINFPGGKEDSLEDITWDEFFEKFEEKQLALLYQDKTAGGKISRFSKIINRETAENNKTAKSSRPAAKKEAKSKTESKARAEAKPKAKSGGTKAKA
ncbi:MAG TPA: hypothetical protein VD908_05800 [Cytophagales bacterium]|nr:hypothetical protein [Cytophagales bacterium]